MTPPDFIYGSGENPMEAIDQGAATTSQVGDNVVAESGGPYPSHSPPWSNNLLEVILHSIIPHKVMLMILPIQIMVQMLHFGTPLKDNTLTHLAPI